MASDDAEALEHLWARGFVQEASQKARNALAGVENPQLGEMLARVTGTSSVQGALSARLSVQGRGADWAEIRRELTGQGQLAIADAVLVADLSGELGARIAEVFRVAGQALGTPGEPPRAATRLGSVATRFEVRGGWMHLGRPVAFTAPFGRAELGG